MNFLTGAGAFLQAFLFGYLGLSPQSHGASPPKSPYRATHLQSYSNAMRDLFTKPGTLLDPVVPAHADNVSVTGVTFGGCTCDIGFDNATVRIRSGFVGCLAITDLLTGTQHALSAAPIVLPRGQLLLTKL